MMALSSSIPTTNALIECPNVECGGLMHPSMYECGDCMNENAFYVGMGQRVITSTRRSFKYGY